MRNRLLILLLLSIYSIKTSAQLVVDNVFLSGHFLQACVSPNGSLGSTENLPAGFYGDVAPFTTAPISCVSPTGNGLASVFDYGRNGWTVPAGRPYDGDYTLPGSPWEGWAIQIGAGSQQNAWFTNLACGTYFSASGALSMTGLTSGYANGRGPCGIQEDQEKGYWSGTFSGLKIRMETRVDTNSSWLVCTVIITNTTAVAVNNIYYLRSCDPDNDEAVGGGFPTNNTIIYNEPLAGTGNRVEVRALGQVYSDAYLALATVDCRAHCFIAESWPDFSGYTLNQYWVSVGAGTGNTYAPGGTDNGDYAIGLVYDIPTLAAGDSTVLCYTYAYKDPGVNIDSPFTKPILAVNCSNPTTISGTPSPGDTINMCTYTSTTASVNILNGDEFWGIASWTWSPAIGLSSTTGTSNTINIALLTNPYTTYTIIGNAHLPSCINVSDTFYVTVALCNGAVANRPCVGDTLKLQCIGDTTGSPSYAWSGPSGFSSALRNPSLYPTTYADTGLYMVIKTLPGGAGDTFYVDVQFLPLPVINMSNNSPFCYGSTDTLLLNVTPVTAGETFVWTGPGGFTSTLPNPVIPTFNAAIAGFYAVTATSSGGCVNTGSTDATFLPSPVPPIITGDTAYCFGATFVPFSVTGVNIVWFPTDTSTIGGTTTAPTVNTSLPGFDTFYARQYPGGCISPMGSITVHVYADIVPSYSFVLNRGCTADTVIFTNNTLNAFNYSWNFSDGTNPVTDVNPTHIFNPSGNYNATVTGYNPACSASFTEQVDTAHPIQAIFSAVPDTICIAQQFTIDATPSIVGYHGLNYAWDFSDGHTEPSTPAIYSYSYAGSGVYDVKLTVTDALGCQSTVDHNVYVVQLLINSFTDTTLCLVQPVPLLNYVTILPSSVFSQGDLNFQWYNSGGAGAFGLNNDFVQVPLFYGIGIFNYVYLVNINNYGCPAVQNITINSIKPPKITNMTVEQTIPYGSSVQLNADMITPSPLTYFWWMPDDGTLNNPNINNPIATPKVTTTYIVYGMDEWGCRDTDQVVIHVDSTVIDNIPSAFTPNGDHLNDIFQPFDLKYQKVVDFGVFNRWGEEIYHGAGANAGWDGTYKGVPQDLGIYNYYIILAHPDGTNVTYRGTVTLLR